MRAVTRDALVSHLSDYERVVEVGIGRRTEVALALAERGCQVTATDITEQTVPESVEFVRDDVTVPTMDVYAEADLLYACNLPPELHRPTLAVAQAVDAAFLFTTLGGDQPTIPVQRRTLPGETLFVARE